jgi:trk system potassium uptake protein TrkH
VGGGALGGVERLALQIVVTALVIEGIGLLVLFLRFLAYFDPPAALWQAIFLTVSAFNNAGFDITAGGPSLVSYQSDVLILLPIGVLVLLGAISYTVLRDVATVRSFRGLLLDTKLVLVVTAVIILIGALGFFLSELGNPTGMGSLPPWEKAMNSLFLSVASRTAGFTPLEIGAMRDYTLFFLIALVFIGGASGSTAGGIKVNTFGVLAVSVLAAIRGQERAEAFGREIPEGQVRRALTIGALGIIWIHGTVFILSALEDVRFIDLFFETVSAFGINGLSTGITGDLGSLSQAVLMASMFVGRLGPLTIGLALAQRRKEAPFRRAQERVKIG